MEITRDNLLALVQDGRKEHKLSIAGLEKQAGVPKDTVRDFLRAKTQILRADKLQKIMRVLEPEQRLAIRSILGTNAEITSLPKSDSPEYTDYPPGLGGAGVEAVLVTSDSMSPVFHEGWIVYYTTERAQAQSASKAGVKVPYGTEGGHSYATHFGKPCVIRLSDDRLMLRTLKEGKVPGSYTLVAYNAPDIKDTTVKDVYKIAFIKTN